MCNGLKNVQWSKRQSIKYVQWIKLGNGIQNVQ